MYRGSTPKFTFPINVPINSISDFVLTFSQHGETILQKSLNDCEVYTEYDSKHKKPRNIISIRLTVEESFLFEPATQLHIQLRGLLEDGIQVVTKELTTYVYDTLYKGPFCKVSYEVVLDSTFEWMITIFNENIKPQIMEYVQEDNHLYKKGEIVNLPEIPEELLEISTVFGKFVFSKIDESDITIEDESEKTINLTWKPEYDWSKCGYFYPGTETNFYSIDKDWDEESIETGELILDTNTNFSSLYNVGDCIQISICNNNYSYYIDSFLKNINLFQWSKLPIKGHVNSGRNIHSGGQTYPDELELSIENNRLIIYANLNSQRQNFVSINMHKLEHRNMYIDQDLTIPNLEAGNKMNCTDLFTGRPYVYINDVWEEVVPWVPPCE